MVKDNLFGKIWPARRGKPPIYSDGLKPEIGIKEARANLGFEPKIPLEDGLSILLGSW